MAIPHRGIGLRSRWVFAVGLGFIIVVLLVAVGHALSLLARDHVIRALKETYASNLELRRFEVALFPRIRITGEGLVFRNRGRSDVPPLISVERFSANTNWIAALTRRRIKHLRLEGLQIHVPPRHGEAGADEGKPEHRKISRFVIDEIAADGTLLEILPKKPGKEPLEFNIQRLTLHGAGPDEPMSFRATLINAKPPGEIQSSGKFGPWQAHEPGLTPVSGTYTFQNADLSVFRGIAGILSSEGSYQGVLDHINVEGHTDTPDFSVHVSGHPVHLTTQFQAVVDGTNGNTLLAPVNAQFGHSALSAWGSVESEPGVKGKTVSLDVTVDGGRLEDMLRLGVRAEAPPMTGAISFRTKLVIPPGNADIAEKLRLDGGFDIGKARFSEFDVQAKVDQISRRGRGEKDDVGVNSVASNFRGRFVLNQGVITFTNLAFNVPGVRISLNGTYGLLDERLDFHGTAGLDAKLSQTTTGIKSFFLKAIDPLFSRKSAGALLPIRISGTRSQPSFGLDR